jgi:hypothetical protein
VSAQRAVTARALLATAAAALLLSGCDRLTERRLRGVWETVDTPKRRLELLADGSYARRLSGKTLGIVSDVLGPERGAWRVEGDALVLLQRGGQTERSERLPIKDLSPEHVFLAGEKWRRLNEPTALPTPSPSP